jgi:hypothetical protein
MDWLSARSRLFERRVQVGSLIENRKSVLLARWCAYLASVIWGVLVLAQLDVTRMSQYASLMYGVEDVWAGCIGSMALFMMARMWFRRSPVLIGLMIHVLLTTFWMYILFSLYFTSPFVYPTAGSTVPVIVILHLYGFTGSQRWANGTPP